ncbi:MAG: DUF1573 domain-containing protein [Bacteroidales bacterium]|jgi:hypothetical protein|nr:DUF1573 domain-containing protein [Bacteroidales bacterium]
MKRIILIAVAMFFMAISQDAKAQWTNPFGAPASNQKAELTTNKSASLEWENTAQLLGEVKQNNERKVTFTFKNTGDKPVFLINAEATCGCTKLEYSKAPVAPGKTGTISTIFDAKELGNFDKSITVYTSLTAPNDVFVLKIGGIVVK